MNFASECLHLKKTLRSVETLQRNVKASSIFLRISLEVQKYLHWKDSRFIDKSHRPYSQYKSHHSQFGHDEVIGW